MSGVGAQPAVGADRADGRVHRRDPGFSEKEMTVIETAEEQPSPRPGGSAAT